ncbi:hypothetical protein ACP70R_006933 [Stipagrostis hirtigluma subsp. patula]
MDLSLSLTNPGSQVRVPPLPDLNLNMDPEPEPEPQQLHPPEMPNPDLPPPGPRRRVIYELHLEEDEEVELCVHFREGLTIGDVDFIETARLLKFRVSAMSIQFDGDISSADDSNDVATQESAVTGSDGAASSTANHTGDHVGSTEDDETTATSSSAVAER